jgi:hypothetical protein
MQCVENCTDPNPRNWQLYEQPVWQTLQMFRTLFHLHPLPWLTSPLPSSRRDAVCVSYRYLSLLFAPQHLPASIGFLPVIYTWLRTRRRPAPVHLTPDSQADPPIHSKFPPPEELRGRKVMLLWIPAVCDLTGTTVRYPSFSLHLTLKLPAFLVDEYRSPVHPGVHISNDKGCSCSLRRYTQRSISPPPSMALSVQSLLSSFLP